MSWKKMAWSIGLSTVQAIAQFCKTLSTSEEAVKLTSGEANKNLLG
jgi:hypothetical protein